MNCTWVASRLSEHLDRELDAGSARKVEDHVASCRACAVELEAFRRVSEHLRQLPRLEAGESIAARVLDRLELERRGPGLAALLRTAGAARPFLRRSLAATAGAALLLLAGTLVLQNATEEELPTPAVANWVTAPPGTEANPLPPLSTLTIPRVTQHLPDPILTGMKEGTTLFVETVVARDGSVSDVKLIRGDALDAQPVLNALRTERFRPGSLRGRPVAVSLYRLIARMDVTPLI